MYYLLVETCSLIITMCNNNSCADVQIIITINIPWAAVDFNESKWTGKITFHYYNQQVHYYDIDCPFLLY